MSIPKGSGSVVSAEGAGGAPIARSPVRPVGPTAVVDGWEVSTLHSGAALTISDQTPLSKVLVRADEAALIDGVGFGRSSRREDGVLVVGSGPGEWLLIGPVGQGGTIASALAGSLARLRHRRRPHARTRAAAAHG